MIESDRLYKLGSNWVYDIDRRSGYMVIRDSVGMVVNFELAYKIKGEGEQLEVEYKVGGVPCGVVRKSMYLDKKDRKE